MPGLVYPGDVYFLRNTPEADFTAEAEILQKKTKRSGHRRIFPGFTATGQKTG